MNYLYISEKGLSDNLMMKASNNEWYSSFLTTIISQKRINFFFTYQVSLLNSGKYMQIKDYVADEGFLIHLLPSKRTRWFKKGLFAQPFLVMYAISDEADPQGLREALDQIPESVSLAFCSLDGSLCSLETAHFLMKANIDTRMVLKAGVNLAFPALKANLNFVILPIKFVLVLFFFKLIK